MIEQTEQAELSEQAVARKVAEYLKDCHPGGITLEVDPDGIQRGEFSWRVRVRPDKEPSKLFEYYEALADVEIELEERERLNVWLVTGDPKPRQIDDRPAHVAEKKAPPSRPSRMSQRWRRATKRAVAQKVAEYLRNCHPGGMTLEVDADGIRKDVDWWDVPVVPDFEPEKLSEYYEALAAVTQALEEREQLKVFLVPGPPKQASEL